MTLRHHLFRAINVLSLLFIGLQNASVGQTQQPATKTVPDYVLYRFLFRKAVFLNERADALDAQGKKGDNLRSIIKLQTQMNDAELQVFNQTVLKHDQEIRAVDAKAKVFLDAYRARYIGGIVPQGEKPVPPPPELKVLQDEKNAITTRYVESLKGALRSDTFGRLDAYARKSVIHRTLPNTSIPINSLMPSASKGGSR